MEITTMDMRSKEVSRSSFSLLISRYHSSMNRTLTIYQLWVRGKLYITNIPSSYFISKSIV